ncbi:MAG TPA: V-type ATPase subunit [Bryobacteraceae bacterium]|nr:V-type ATPase subunit [Bryobacteraceae bacterium]
MSLFSYAAVQGYIRARISRLLDRPTWTRLVEANSSAELARLLGETPMALAVADSGAVRLHVLRGEAAAAGQALMHFLPRSSRELLAWHNRRFEIENLKTVLRAVHYQLERQRALASLIPLRGTRWRWEALVETGSVAAVIDQIRESPYAAPLENAMERYQQEGRLFFLEVAVDLFYFQRLVRLIEAQNGRDAADARRFLGRWIAVQNLLWAYRYRIYGRMTPEEIINYSLHRAFGAGLETVRRVALGAPPAVEAGRLGFEVSPQLSDLEALTEIEILAERERFRSASAMITRPLFRLGGALAYLWLLEGEIRDLTVIVEGKATGLARAEIARRLVRTT